MKLLDYKTEDYYDNAMRDYPLIMGNLVLGAVLTLLGNMLADAGYGLADPRIRTSARQENKA